MYLSHCQGFMLLIRLLFLPQMAQATQNVIEIIFFWNNIENSKILWVVISQVEYNSNSTDFNFPRVEI